MNHNGFPTYAWDCVPSWMLTKRQLREAGLRPGGADPVAQLRWGEHGVAYLYDIRRAKAVRAMTPGRQRTLNAMMRVRSTCKACGFIADWCLPRRYGRLCPDCSAAEGCAYV